MSNKIQKKERPTPATASELHGMAQPTHWNDDTPIGKPNSASTSKGSAAMDCPRCNGTGWIYTDPKVAQAATTPSGGGKSK